ncbi:MAG: sugar phosphate isomerase/epimerase [Verrucomicrobiaceae bacterium]|nr:sugar phosphate isomerase/epimerase [Verrucomicrobiaceae bacterium]
MKRRKIMKSLGAGILGSTLATPSRAAGSDFRLRYILSSAMYGEMPLASILPEVLRAGCEAIDIWCRVHGNQREQIEFMGDAPARKMFEKHRVRPAVFTRYPLGPFGLREEMKKVKESFGAEIVVCGSTGPRGPSGKEARSAVRGFLEKMKPHVAVAEETGIRIAVENHSGQLLYHPDALRYFAELNASSNLGIAFAPHHLHKFSNQIPTLIRELGDRNIPFMYFQEHSEGMYKKSTKAVEMQQLPGFGGGLDYKPVVKALKDIGYSGYCEIFMHPVPRGIPVLPTVAEVTAVIKRSRAYIEECLAKV